MRCDFNGQDNAQLEENGNKCLVKVESSDNPLIRPISHDRRQFQGPGSGSKTFNNSGIDTRSKPAGPSAEERCSTTTDLWWFFTGIFNAIAGGECTRTHTGVLFNLHTQKLERDVHLRLDSTKNSMKMIRMIRFTTCRATLNESCLDAHIWAYRCDSARRRLRFGSGATLPLYGHVVLSMEFCFTFAGLPSS